MINKLIEKTNELIKSNESNKKNQEKYIIIKKILNKNNCFLDMSIDYAYSILRDLNFKENELKNIYLDLIDMSNKKSVN